MSNREKLLLREVDKDTPSGNDIANLEADNNEQSNPDLHLQQLINNYRKAADELSKYLQNNKPPEEPESMNGIFVNNIPGKKKYEEKRQSELKRIELKEKQEAEALRKKSNSFNKFIKGIFKY